MAIKGPADDLTTSASEPVFACLADPVQDGCPSSTTIRVAGFTCDGFYHPVALEFLATPVRLKLGLIGRRGIAHSTALFVLGAEKALPLATQDVFYPIDVVAIAEDGSIKITSTDATPGKTVTALPQARGIAVMAGGEAARMGITPSCTFSLDPDGPDVGGFTPRKTPKPGLPKAGRPAAG